MRCCGRRIPETTYQLRLDDARPARARGRDLVKGILTNLLQNAAEAAGAGGSRARRHRDRATARSRSRCTIPGPASARRRRRRCSSRRSRSRSTAWDSACRSRRRTRCSPAATSRSSTGELGGAGFRVTLPPSPATPSGGGRMTRTRHIVVVDDEPNIGRSLRLILEGEGYRVTVCESAAAVPGERRRGARRPLPARRPAAGRQRHRPAARAAAERRCDAGGDDFRPRHDSRRRRGDAERRVRLPREAARARSRAAGHQERARASRTCSARTSASASWSATRRR